MTAAETCKRDVCDGRTPSLSPAYDYLSTIVYMPDGNIGMDLSETKSFAQIDATRIQRLAARAHLSTKIAERAAREMVTRMREIWPTIQDTLPIDEGFRAAITSHMESIPLFRAPTAAQAASAEHHRKTTAGGGRQRNAT